MSVTIIPVLYRDHADNRWYGEVQLDGEITNDERAAIRASLLDGKYYAPVQIGLSHCGQGESTSFPGLDDHGFHEMDLDNITIEENLFARTSTSVRAADDGGTVHEFLARVKNAAVAGWQPMLPAC